MPNTTSAQKALRQSERHRVLNIKRKRALKDALKELERAIASKNKSEAAQLFSKAQKVLDKSTKNNIIKKNTASRKKSRLAHQLAKL